MRCAQSIEFLVAATWAKHAQVARAGWSRWIEGTMRIYDLPSNRGHFFSRQRSPRLHQRCRPSGSVLFPRLTGFSAIAPHLVYCSFPILSYGPYGKPRPPGWPRRVWIFNLAHTDDTGVNATNLHCEVGIDIEATTRDPVSAGVARSRSVRGRVRSMGDPHGTRAARRVLPHLDLEGGVCRHSGQELHPSNRLLHRLAEASRYDTLLFDGEGPGANTDWR